ncbi:Fc.00g074400.m01.CDS01 [Cosmosporella sp. VM-42]
MFGLITTLTGVLYFRYMPENQLNAKFLTEEERIIAIERIRDNFQGIGNRVWKWEQFWEAMRDPRTWLYGLYSLTMNIPNSGNTTFRGIIISSFYFDKRTSLLLSAPASAVDACGKLIFPWLSDRFIDRTLFSCIAILFSMLSSILMIGLIMVLISNNTLGYTKKVTVNSIRIISYAAGNWIGPQTFRSSDAPEYREGKIMIVYLYRAAALILVVIRFVNIHENRRRDKLELTSGIGPNDPVTKAEIDRAKFMDLTDYQ